MNYRILIVCILAAACTKTASAPQGVADIAAVLPNHPLNVAAPGAGHVAPAVPVADAASPSLAAPVRVKAGGSAGFVTVAAGRFQMGVADTPGSYNDAAQHPVVIGRAFELMAAEVTVKQYAEIMSTSGDQQSDCQDCPAAMVSWYQAATYCNDLSKRRGLAQCYRIDGFAVSWPEGVACSGYRLPTEAEWEYAARAGANDTAPANISDHAWFDENSGLKTHAVMEKLQNPFGLFDMLGNVAEWVWDWQGEYPSGTVADPIGPKGGNNRVFRGGNFRYGSGEASYGFRSAYGPPVRVEYVGFRCARTLPDLPARQDP